MIIFPLAAALALLAACAGQGGAEAPAPEAEPLSAVVSPAPEAGADNLIRLDRPEALPAGASCENGVLSLTAAGTYRLAGSLSGQIRVDADGPVELILEGVSLRGRECVYILSGDPVTITAAAGTENYLSDGAAEADANAHAVIYSKAPLTIGGEGSITVAAGANNGVQSREGLTVSGGRLAVAAVNHGLKARGPLAISGGEVSIRAGADGLNAESARLEEGSVLIAGGTVEIAAGARAVDAEGTAALSGGRTAISAAGDGIRANTVNISGGQITLAAGGDGVQAEGNLSVSGGDVSITAGGGGGGAIDKSGDSFGPMMQPAQAQEPDVSAKGLKAGGNITVAGGIINLNTADDSIHCGVLCTIGGGDITILSGDDAVHSDDMLVINDGDIRITDCFEGLEAFAVEVNGGNIIIRAVNDGINANGPEMMGFGGPGRNTAATAAVTSVSGASVTYFRQTGGTIDLVVTGNSRNVGDGVDSNGSLYIDGGVLTVSTQGNTQEAGLDYGGGEFVITGGMVMAGGSSMMQESLSASSTQCCAVITMNTQNPGTVVTILDEDGNELWSVTMEDAFSCLVLSHPDMEPGHVYTVAYGESSSTLDFTDTTVISGAGGFGFGFPGGPGGGPGGRPF